MTGMPGALTYNLFWTRPISRSGATASAGTWAFFSGTATAPIKERPSMEGSQPDKTPA